MVFTLIVVIHEGGHFWMARKMGVFVEEFAIGMGPAIYKRMTKKGMRFSIRALPIGGFCQMKGEEQQEGVVPDEDSFTGKKPWQRALIVFAGPFMNFVLAFVLLLILNIAVGYISREVVVAEADFPAAEAGLEEGDTIIGMNGEIVRSYSKVTLLMMFYEPGDEVTLKVRTPEGEVKTLTFVPKLDEASGRYRMGFSVTVSGSLKDQIEKSGFFPAVGSVIAQSFWDMLFQIEMTIRSFGMLLSGKVGLDGLTGPVGIVSVVNTTVQESKSYGIMAVVQSMMDLTVLISANLGVLNLFPIPGLDGSRLLFLLIEKIRRKPMNPKVENAIYLVGFVLLFGLMIVVAFNDILRLFK
ncbi:MAG: site-2 protease family protein [Firmicutes bacterium]|nr:site-2 protease family protein [Bacillota bacterium]